MRTLNTQARRSTTQLAQDEGVHAASVHRWIRRGVIGPDGERIRLRATRVGGRWYVGAEDWSAFGTALNAEPAKGPQVVSPSARSRAAIAAAAELARLGI
ncbi:hypothetical protein [Singulisphaera sp. PoT]|uniref:hypothetical protein n=1 Tax=Singulisphaera sp. PoT TaxID=3411797 RepID=UPI003BF5B918